VYTADDDAAAGEPTAPNPASAAAADLWETGVLFMPNGRMDGQMYDAATGYSCEIFVAFAESLSR
jgi:hypothetical protein